MGKGIEPFGWSREDRVGAGAVKGVESSSAWRRHQSSHGGEWHRMHVALILLCCSFLQRLGDRPMTVAGFPFPFLVPFWPALGLSALPNSCLSRLSFVFARFWSTASCRFSSFLTVSPPLFVLKAEFSLDKGSRPFCKICPDCLCMLPRCCCAAECVSASHFFSTSSSMIGSQARGPLPPLSLHSSSTCGSPAPSLARVVAQSAPLALFSAAHPHTPLCLSFRVQIHLRPTPATALPLIAFCCVLPAALVGSALPDSVSSSTLTLRRHPPRAEVAAAAAPPVVRSGLAVRELGLGKQFESNRSEFLNQT